LRVGSLGTTVAFQSILLEEGVATMAEQSSCNLTSFAKTGG
jgi:hypothetical protein